MCQHVRLLFRSLLDDYLLGRGVAMEQLLQSPRLIGSCAAAGVV